MIEASTISTRTSPLDLFEYSVVKVNTLGLMDKPFTHQAWANMIFHFKNSATERSELMSIVKREYSVYFNDELQYCFIGDKIRANFPYLFGIKESDDLFERMDQALEAECAEQRSSKNQKRYSVIFWELISKDKDLHVYKVSIRVEEGDDPHFSEGMPLEVKTTDTYYYCEALEFDYVNSFLFFSSQVPVYITANTKVWSDPSFNTVALKDLLKEISFNPIDRNLPIFKFLNCTTANLSSVGYSVYPEYLDRLLESDISQQEAFKAALGNDITFIWGPPGTGKSYTLAAIIMALYYMKNERTAVCCLSNVAVDQLTNKVVDIIDAHVGEMPRGEFYRAGRIHDTRLISKDFLFPDDDTSCNLRDAIEMLNDAIDNYRKKQEQYSDNAIILKAQLKEYRAQLKDHTDYLIGKVKVVFSTISNFVINPRLKDGLFDNLIVDEASMLAEPQLIALARKVSKRIILVGDFQQLSPITVAGVPILRNSVFGLCNINIGHTDHPALHQLLNQRRSNPKIVDVINSTFYHDRLIAMNSKYDPVVARAPFSSVVIGLKSVSNGAVRFTKGGTRQNVMNAYAVIELLDKYYKPDEHETFTIGVITPYRGQVALLKSLFLGKGYDLDFQERVRIGTVHTFQGSECNVIIFDMVDCSRFEKGKESYFGRIYGGEQGEQLMNVAVSRAKNKLIVVCEPEYLKLCPGGVISSKSYTIFQKLLTSPISKS